MSCWARTTASGIAEVGFKQLGRTGGQPSEVTAKPFLERPSGAGALLHAVLREYGNMSAPTVLFALERVLNLPAKGALALSALGPGFTASMVALDPVRG